MLEIFLRIARGEKPVTATMANDNTPATTPIKIAKPSVSAMPSESTKIDIACSALAPLNGYAIAAASKKIRSPIARREIGWDIQCQRGRIKRSAASRTGSAEWIAMAKARREICLRRM